MAVLYRVYKDNRENSLTSGQYFARAIHTGELPNGGTVAFTAKDGELRLSVSPAGDGNG